MAKKEVYLEHPFIKQSGEYVHAGTHYTDDKEILAMIRPKREEERMLSKDYTYVVLKVGFTDRNGQRIGAGTHCTNNPEVIARGRPATENEISDFKKKMLK